MPEELTGLLRWGRALILALVVLVIGAIGHVTADGLLPSPAALLMLFGATTLVAAGLLGRPASRTRLVTLTAGGQTILHLALTALAGHTEPTPVTHAPAHVEHAHAHAGAMSVVLDQLAHLLGDLAAHAPMAAAHLVAAVVVGLWLAVGEEALWLLVGLAATRVLRLVTPFLGHLPGPAPAATPAPAGHLPAPRLLTLARCVVRRGPPVLLAG